MKEGKNMIRGYLATHFFNEAGFEHSAKLAKLIRENTNIDLYVPQENGEINDKSGDDSHITDISIADGDCLYLNSSNILIASLDGVEIDSGVSAEIGYFSGLITAEKVLSANPRIRYIIGVYTDVRQNGSGDNHFYINLFTKGLVRNNGIIVKNSEELVLKLAKLEEIIKKDIEMGGIL
jgi:nucleoside 2-deoxyribosyltransferase